MSELMAWDGPWSPDLINLMLPVATEIIVKRERSHYNGALAAVASVFKAEVGKDYSDALDGVLRDVRREQLEARGFSKQELADIKIEEFARQLAGLKGLRKR